MKKFATYTPQEVANMMGVTRRTVYNWISLDKLPAHKVGPKLWVIAHNVLTTFMAGGDAHYVASENQRYTNLVMGRNSWVLVPLADGVPDIDAALSQGTQVTAKEPPKKEPVKAVQMQPKQEPRNVTPGGAVPGGNVSTPVQVKSGATPAKVAVPAGFSLTKPTVPIGQNKGKQQKRRR